MPVIRKTAPIAIFSNAQPAPLLPNQEFKHALGHAVNGLVNALRQADKQKTFSLNSTNSGQVAITNEALAKTALQAKKNMLQIFDQQNRARKFLADNRIQIVRTHNTQSDANGVNGTLENFKAEESALPEPQRNEITERCCATVNRAEDKTQKKHNGCEHEEGGGIVIDLDEAAHGAFACSKYLSEVAQGRPEAVVESFKTNAAELGAEPIRYLGKELTENGVADFSTAVGAGALMLPLAALAVKAGIEEWQHGSHQLRELKVVRKDQTEELENLRGAAEALPSENMQARIQAQEIRLEKSGEAMKQAQKDREIGAMSAASGFTIGLKALSDLALKISLGIKGASTGKGFFALSESAQTGTAAAGAAVGFGLAGTFVLGPLAGLFATALGAFFTIKTVTKLKQLKSDFEHLKADIKTDSLTRAGETGEVLEPLRNFLIRQGEKRIGFFKRFARWNKAFMVGSGLYAASAVTKAVVVGVAAAGLAAAASNPIGLGVITAVGIIGAIAMGVASLSFIRGHGKQGKYSRATAADHPWVDRKLMTDLHGLQAMNHVVLEGDETTAISNKHKGFDMAATCLKYLDTQKNLLREFMNEVAKTSGKHSPLEKNLSWWKYLSGQILNRKTVHRFLNTENGRKQFLALTQQSLVAKTEMLAEKLCHRKTLLNTLKLDVRQATPNAAGLASPVTTNDLDQLEQLRKTFERMDSEYGRDQAELELSLLHLKTIESNPEADFKTISDCIEAGSTTKDASKFVHQQMDRDIRRARGVLFESQLEGSRLREKQYQELNKTRTISKN